MSTMSVKEACKFGVYSGTVIAVVPVTATFLIAASRALHKMSQQEPIRQHLLYIYNKLLG